VIAESNKLLIDGLADMLEGSNEGFVAIAHIVMIYRTVLRH